MQSHILVIGKTGQLACCLSERSSAISTMRFTFLGRDDLNLEDTNRLADVVAAYAPDLVIIAAAYTAVDKAETDEATAHRINALAPGEIAKGAARVGAPIIHVSTDYVFDGAGRRSYREDDPVSPLGVYGATKLAGERAVEAANPKHVIARTAWVYSAFGGNFIKTMLRVGAGRDAITVVDDQLGNPTSAHDLARILLSIAGDLLAGPKQEYFGVFHVAGIGSASWCDFARFVFMRAASVWKRKPVVTAILTEQYPTPARRPANSRLDTSKLQAVYGIVPALWTDEAAAVIDSLLVHAPDKSQ